MGLLRFCGQPVLRDVTERIVMASKGRFDRASRAGAKRKALGLPFEDTIDAGDFRSWTLDTWHFPPESAKRVGHPAPFPGRAAPAGDRAQHVQGRLRPRPVSSGSGQTRIACAWTAEPPLRRGRQSTRDRTIRAAPNERRTGEQARGQGRRHGRGARSPLPARRSGTDG